MRNFKIRNEKLGIEGKLRFRTFINGKLQMENGKFRSYAVIISFASNELNAIASFRISNFEFRILAKLWQLCKVARIIQIFQFGFEHIILIKVLHKGYACVQV